MIFDLIYERINRWFQLHFPTNFESNWTASGSDSYLFVFRWMRFRNALIERWIEQMNINNISNQTSFHEMFNWSVNHNRPLGTHLYISPKYPTETHETEKPLFDASKRCFGRQSPLLPPLTPHRYNLPFCSVLNRFYFLILYLMSCGLTAGPIINCLRNKR